MFNLLIIENDQMRSHLYCSFLGSQGFNALASFNATEALATFESTRVDVVVCDTSLPEIDGIITVEMIRAISHDVPIIMVSDQCGFKTKQRAFFAGCDDFMGEPIDLNELSLRIFALLKRSRLAAKQQVIIGDAVLDSSSFTVVEGNMSTTLPPKEFMLLFKLCASPGRIFSRRDIMDDVWGIHAESGERTVDVHVKRLRKRFEDSRSFKIETVRGVGYKAIEYSG